MPTIRFLTTFFSRLMAERRLYVAAVRLVESDSLPSLGRVSSLTAHDVEEMRALISRHTRRDWIAVSVAVAAILPGAGVLLAQHAWAPCGGVSVFLAFALATLLAAWRVVARDSNAEMLLTPLSGRPAQLLEAKSIARTDLTARWYFNRVLSRRELLVADWKNLRRTYVDGHTRYVQEQQLDLPIGAPEASPWQLLRSTVGGRLRSPQSVYEFLSRTTHQ